MRDIFSSDEMAYCASIINHMPDTSFKSSLFDKDVKIEIFAEKKSYYYSEYEYNILKQICVYDENDTQIVQIKYNDRYSRYSNGGRFEIDECIFFPADNQYPEGYQFAYQKWRGSSMIYNVNGTEYRVFPGTIIKNNEDVYYWSEDILYKKCKSFDFGIEKKDEKVIDSDIEYEEIRNIYEACKPKMEQLEQYPYKDVLMEIVKKIEDKKNLKSIK